jgi:hypothetical protein
MNDLPNAPVVGNTSQSTDVTQKVTTTTGSISKEIEGGIHPISETPPLVEVGKDIELPKEVVRAGVTIQPTVIPIPPHLTSAGVAPAGQNVTVGTGNTVVLPLTDDQIAQGLKQGITNSWRWLAEWCRRKLKLLHSKLLSIHGKSTNILM